MTPSADAPAQPAAAIGGCSPYPRHYGLSRLGSLKARPFLSNIDRTGLRGTLVISWAIFRAITVLFDSLVTITLRQATVGAMVIFAVLGAITAYRGAKTEQDSTLLAEKLAQGQLIEVSERQRRETLRTSSRGLQARGESFRRYGAELARDADSLWSQGRYEEAAWKEMRSREEFAAARAIRLFSDEFWSPQEVENGRVAEYLAGLGFAKFVNIAPTGSSTLCAHPGPAGSSPLWCDTRHRLEALHDQVRALALAVAAFVLSLAFFTASDASARARWKQLKWILLAAGLLTGVNALLLAVLAEPAAWPWLVAGFSATAVAWLGLHMGVAFAERKGWVHPNLGQGAVEAGEVGGERGFFRAPVLGHHGDHWFGIVTVILLAATVFLSSLVGWGLSVANTHADSAAEEAREAAAEMVVRNSRFSARQAELVGEFGEIVQRQFRLALASDRVQLSKYLSIVSKYQDEDAHHLQELTPARTRFEDSGRIIGRKELSIEDDPHFPRRLLWQFPRVSFDGPLTVADQNTDNSPHDIDKPDQRTRNALESFAEWAQLSSLSVAWREVATRFLAGLMIFAISLYFLGQALAMEPTRSGYVLLLAGVAFGCLGIGSSLVSSYPMLRLATDREATSEEVAALLKANECPGDYPNLSEGSHEPRELPGARQLAAYFYSIGVVLAENGSDYEGDPKKAWRYLSCALALNEDFVFARLKLAQVQSKLDSLDSTEPFFSMTAKEKLERQVTSYETAQERLQSAGLDLSSSQRSSYAFNTALDGLIRHDDRALARADSIIRETLHLIEGGKMFASWTTVALLRLNRGFVQLASKHYQEARKEYSKALDVEPAEFDSRKFALRASALTDIDMVRSRYCSEDGIAKVPDFDCRALFRTILDIKSDLLVERGHEGLSSARGIPGKNLVASTTAGALQVTVGSVNPQSDGLWLIWSRYEEIWDAWRTLQSISRPIGVASSREFGVHVVSSYLKAYEGPGCLPKGEYRAELYSHGTLVATNPVKRSQEPMKLARLPKHNVQLCIPNRWTIVPVKMQAGRQPGDYDNARVLVDADGQNVVFIYTTYMPDRSQGLQSCLRPEQAVECAVDILAETGMVSRNAPRLRFDDPRIRSGPVDGALIVLNAKTQDGGMHVLIAKTSAAPVAQLLDILSSAELIYSDGNR